MVILRMINDQGMLIRLRDIINWTCKKGNHNL
jgi:hypothetical protein